MNTSNVTCPLCGHRFRSQGRSICGACPLAKGCEFVCCPACGYQIPDTQRSLIGRWLAAGFRRRAAPAGAAPPTLADVPAGWSARIAETGGASAPRRQQLRAYGLEALTWVRVIQHRPVTVVVVAGTELALEAELARRVVVDSLKPQGEVGPSARPFTQGPTADPRQGRTSRPGEAPTGTAPGTRSLRKG